MSLDPETSFNLIIRPTLEHESFALPSMNLRDEINGDSYPIDVSELDIMIGRF